jgi:hypothetical protein
MHQGKMAWNQNVVSKIVIRTLMQQGRGHDII